MDLGRHAGAFAAEQQGVVGRKATSGKRWAPDVVSSTSRPGVRSRWKAAQEACRTMRGQVVVVHGGAADALVVDRKAAGLDDVERRAQAGGQADEGAEILRDIGLEQGKAHGACSTPVRAAKARRRAARCHTTGCAQPATNRALKHKGLCGLKSHLLGGTEERNNGFIQHPGRRARRSDAARLSHGRDRRPGRRSARSPRPGPSSTISIPPPIRWRCPRSR